MYNDIIIIIILPYFQPGYWMAYPYFQPLSCGLVALGQHLPEYIHAFPHGDFHILCITYFATIESTVFLSSSSTFSCWFVLMSMSSASTPCPRLLLLVGAEYYLINFYANISAINSFAAVNNNYIT